MKVITGQYVVDFYDKYGNKIKNHKTVKDNFIEALTYGQQTLSKEIKSFTIDRRIINSIDSDE